MNTSVNTSRAHLSRQQQQKHQQEFYQQQFKVITEWLKELFGSDEVPPFELNPRTLHLLSQLAMHSRRRTKEFYVVGRELKRQCDEYRAETSMLDSVLQRLKGSTSSTRSNRTLEDNGQWSVAMAETEAVETEAESLARVATDLELRDVSSVGSSNTMFVALHALQDQLDESIDRNFDAREKLQKMKQQSQDMTHRLAHLERLHAQLNEKRDTQELPLMKQQQVQITQYFHPKQSDYTDQINELKRQLTVTGYDHASLRHHALSELATQMESLHKGTVEPKRAKLRLYHKLPADIDLAQAELEEKKQLKLELDHQIQQRIQNYEN